MTAEAYDAEDWDPEHPDLQHEPPEVCTEDPVDFDGAYGPQSEGVCREFQRRFGLQVDGIVGPITWRRAFS